MAANSSYVLAHPSGEPLSARGWRGSLSPEAIVRAEPPAARLVRLLDAMEGRLSAPPPEREFLTLAEVAQVLGVSKRTVEGLVASRYLESSVLPGTRDARRVSREQLAAYKQRFHDGK